MDASSLLVDDGFTVRRRFVSSMNNAVYLLTKRASGEQLLIDAADDPAAISALIAEGAQDVSDESQSTRSAASTAARDADTRGTGTQAPEPRLTRIVTTHAHWDHTRATADVAAQTGASVAIGREDAAQLRSERGVDAHELLDHGDTVPVGGLALEVIALRGHTPGSVALALPATDTHPALVFTGDSLFPGGVGNTNGDPQRFEQLFADVTARIFDRFDDETRVFPGHGDPTTLGDERASLPEWHARGW